jgi:hypothetical protein
MKFKNFKLISYKLERFHLLNMSTMSIIHNCNKLIPLCKHCSRYYLKWLWSGFDGRNKYFHFYSFFYSYFSFSANEYMRFWFGILVVCRYWMRNAIERNFLLFLWKNVFTSDSAQTKMRPSLHILKTLAEKWKSSRCEKSCFMLCYD